MHNGVIDEFERDQRSLTLAIDPDFFYLKGSTDPEVIVFLLLTHSLTADP